jgi:hypothetical protein
MTPDARLRFRLLTSEEGGRQGKGFSGNGWFFNCPLLAPDGSYWDCRVFYGHQELQAGVDSEFGLLWLSPESAPAHFPPGSHVTLGAPAWLLGSGMILTA